MNEKERVASSIPEDGDIFCWPVIDATVHRKLPMTSAPNSNIINGFKCRIFYKVLHIDKSLNAADRFVGSGSILIRMLNYFIMLFGEGKPAEFSCAALTADGWGGRKGVFLSTGLYFRCDRFCIAEEEGHAVSASVWPSLPSLSKVT